MTSTFYGRRRRGVPSLLVAITIAVVLGVVIGLTFTACSPRQETAAADPLTSVRNIGSLSGAPGDVVLVRDNGVYVLLRPGATLWGIRAVRIDRGHCVRIDGAAARCAIDRAAYNVSLSIGAHTVERTR